ncbi:MAG TPA: hypothetical protein VGR31_10390 [Planctomycetota bacterium]|jgi:hypothetical protein|nr:hypothetical protein [Planctomycetota bacterium]
MSDSSTSLLDAWSSWTPTTAPFILPADREILASDRSRRATTTLTSWEAARDAENFEEPGDRRFHLGLLPHPYCGDLRRASIFVLLLNAGHGPTNYYGEYAVPEYREALLATIRQDFTSIPRGHLYFDPRFAWHGGFRWWHGKFAGVIGELATMWSATYAEARSRFAQSLASIELIPYHSPKFHDPDRWLSRLQSVRLARDFVHNSVLPRVLGGEAIVIATRKVGLWGLPQHPGVICYDGVQARGAHMTPLSPGGSEILRFLRTRST